MKRYLALALVLILLSLFFIACSLESKMEKEERPAILAVITTSGSEKKSALHFFDTDLQTMDLYSLPYASVGSDFYVPEVRGKDLYLPTHGYANLKDEENVLHIDLNELRTELIFVGQPGINSLCLQENYLYTCNTLDNVSYISQVDLKTRKVQSTAFSDIYVTKLIADKHHLYAFTTKLVQDLSSSLYILDSKLKVLDTIDLSSYGITQYKAIQDDNYVYFSNSIDSQDQPNHLVARFDKTTKKINSYALNHFMPSDLLLRGDDLLISHYNPVTTESDGITILNLSTQVQTHHSLPHGIEQMVLLHDSLYILSEEKVYAYLLEDTKLRLLNQGALPMEKGGEYTSGLFIMP